MNEFEEIIIKAIENKNTINISEILNLNLKFGEYEILIEELKCKNIDINYDFIEEATKSDVEFCDDPVKQYIRSISKIKLLSPEESNNLFNEYRISHSEQIREKLIISNLRLVVNVAKEYMWKLKNNSHEFLDIIQEGNKGLMIAIEKFDPSLGNKFSSYAVWWILSQIESALVHTGKFIRVPTQLINDYNKIQKYKAQIEKDGKIGLTDLQIALMMGMKEKRAKNVIEIGSRIVISTDEPVSTDKDTTKSNYISVETPSIEDITIEKMNYELIEDIMKSVLTEREFFAISYRFGIINEVNNVPGKKTLEDVGIALGISRQRVNQMFKCSFEKIKTEYQARMSEKTYVKKKIKN